MSLLLAALVSLLLFSRSYADDSLADLVQAGQHEAALALVQAGANVNAPQSNKTTALHWAAYHGDVTLAKELIAHGAEADATNAYGSTPLGEAANVANVELMKLLLDAGASPESPNADGMTALMVAVRTGVTPAAELLIKRGANVNAAETWRGQTALMWAAGEARPDMVDLLIAHGANVSARAIANDWARQVTSEPRAQYRPTGGMTPLLYAARSGCERCVAAILEAGADINLPNPDGVTPLMVAIDNYHFDLAKYLLGKGANPTVWDWWGRTALYIAIDMNSYRGGGGFGEVPAPMDIPDKTSALDIARLLLEKGVDPNIQLVLHRPDRAGQGRFTDDPLRTGATPLTRAAVNCDLDAIKLLVAHGADANLPTAMGLTPLMVVSGMGVTTRDMRGGYQMTPKDQLQARSLAALDALIAAGADVNAKITDTTSWTARVARINSLTDKDGQTAIFAAAGWGWTDVVKYLIAHGADLGVKDAHGKTPLDAAKGQAGGRPDGASLSAETAKVVEDAMRASGVREASAG
jgi:ankyrin repeat protein